MGSSELLDQQLAEVGMNMDKILKAATLSMLDGNPSIYHNEFAGDKIKFEQGEPVMVTKYHSHPDICAVVLEPMGTVLKLLTVDGEETIFVRKDGIQKINMEDDEAWARIRTKAESEAFYGPRREQRRLEIELAIAVTKL